MLEILVTVGLMVYYFFERLVQMLLPVKWRAKDVSGDIVLITGGGSGIGRLLAKYFAKLGSTIVVWDVNQQGNLETVKQIVGQGGRAHAYQCDISNREEVYKLAERVKAEVGEVTILINNAGIVNGKELLDTPDEKIEKIFDINVLAHFWTVKAFLPDMLKKNHGHIVTIASLAGYVGINRLVDYCSTKFAALGFHEALMAELDGKGYDGVKTTAICPFYINTGMFDGVKSRLIPILEPEDAVRQIVDAVLTNETQLILPKHLLIMVVLKMIWPIKILKLIGDISGANKSMELFRGRIGGN